MRCFLGDVLHGVFLDEGEKRRDIEREIDGTRVTSTVTGVHRMTASEREG